MLLFFYDRPYEKIYETKLLALGCKKEVLNLFFSLLEEGKIDDGAD